MKKLLLLTVVLAGVIMVLVAGGFRNIPYFLDEQNGRTTCVGYTIIEYKKGINCNGDTITLVRKNGFAQQAGQR
jgi:FlaG/FlaF family flagellin (archaellin)